LTCEDKSKQQNKSPEQVSQEEIKEFFEEEQRLEEVEIRKKVTKAAEDARKKVLVKALNSADIIGMIKAEDGQVMDWMYRTLTPDIHSKEINPYGWDGSHKGGGSKNKRKKDKKSNKIFVDPWTGI
jgi:hypothetical protein